MLTGLSGKRAIVTAGASGIGRAIAKTFLAADVRVHICDIDEPQIASACEALPGLGATRADVADPADVDRLFDEAMIKMGGLDILVNNAGVAGPVGPVEEIDFEGWRHCIAVGLDGTFLCTRRAVPLLREAGGGSIVNISSAAGLHGFPNRSPYATAKWGIIGFTKTLAMEQGEHGIRVNAICPGSVAGDRIDSVIAAAADVRGMPAEEMRNIWLNQVSMRTFVEDQDIANMALFICSGEGAKISGQALSVDGHTESLSA